jgi:hypothetical protein
MIFLFHGQSICIHLAIAKTNCGGIDPYTLMAPLGPRQTRWPNSPERATWISELLGKLCGASKDYLMIKGIESVRVDIVSSVDTTVVIDWD